MVYDAKIGIIDIISKTFIIPIFSAIKPNADNIIAVIPQQNPFAKPDTILLYCGRIFCASIIVSGCDKFVINPMSAKAIILVIGIEL